MSVISTFGGLYLITVAMFFVAHYNTSFIMNIIYDTILWCHKWCSFLYFFRFVTVPLTARLQAGLPSIGPGIDFRGGRNICTSYIYFSRESVYMVPAPHGFPAVLCCIIISLSFELNSKLLISRNIKSKMVRWPYSWLVLSKKNVSVSVVSVMK